MVEKFKNKSSIENLPDISKELSNLSKEVKANI
jgi:hypothetical protein